MWGLETGQLSPSLVPERPVAPWVPASPLSAAETLCSTQRRAGFGMEGHMKPNDCHMSASSGDPYNMYIAV